MHLFPLSFLFILCTDRSTNWHTARNKKNAKFSRCNGIALMQSQPRLCLHTQCIFLRTVCTIRWGKIERRVGGMENFAVRLGKLQNFYNAPPRGSI